MTDDAALLRRYAEEKSEQAFAEFVRRHIGLVYGAALRRTGGDAPQAEDVAQRVFVAVARHATTLMRHASVSGWLYTATRNAAHNLMRDEQRRRRREGEAQAAIELLAATEAGVDWMRLRPVLDEAMDALSDRDREAVLLRFFEGRALAEVGERLEVTENTARMRVERALEKLRTHLAKRGVTSTSAALGVLLANEAGAAAPAAVVASVTSAALVGASATGASAAGLGVMSFMSATKLIVSGATILALVGIGCAVFEARRARETDAALVTAQRQAEGWQMRLKAAEQKHEVALARVAALEKDLEAAKKNGSQPAAGNAGAALTNVPLRQRRAWDDAKTKEEKAKLHRRYDRFTLEQRGLTPEQAERYVELRLAQAQAGEDLQEAVRQAGLNGDHPGVEKLRSTLTDPIVKELRELLGEEGYMASRDYERVSGLRGYIDPMLPAFAAAGQPLSMEQGDQLARLISSNFQSYRANPTDIGTQIRIDWEKVITQAKTVLTPEQWMIFQTSASRLK